MRGNRMRIWKRVGAVGAAMALFALLTLQGESWMPWMEKGLSAAAVFSAGLYLPDNGREIEEEREEISSQAPPEQNASSVPDKEPESSSSGGLTDVGTSGLPEGSPVILPGGGSSSGSTQKPADAGKITERQYPITGNGYVNIGSTSVRNYTKQTAATIQKLAGAGAAFSVDLESGQPQVLIFHTHASESYESADLGWYDPDYSCRDLDPSRNMVRVGEEIARELEAAGIPYIHDKTIHDYPSYNASYSKSYETVEKWLKKYPSIQIILDVHRDALETDGVRMKPTAVINGKKSAQVMIISGCDDGTMNFPNWKKNLGFAGLLANRMEEMFPGLTRPILFDYRKYNMHTGLGGLLIEVGGHANTLEEAVYAGELFGKALSQVVLGLAEE